MGENFCRVGFIIHYAFELYFFSVRYAHYDAFAALPITPTEFARGICTLFAPRDTLRLLGVIHVYRLRRFVIGNGTQWNEESFATNATRK